MGSLIGQVKPLAQLAPLLQLVTEKMLGSTYNIISNDFSCPSDRRFTVTVCESPSCKGPKALNAWPDAVPRKMSPSVLGRRLGLTEVVAVGEILSHALIDAVIVTMAYQLLNNFRVSPLALTLTADGSLLITDTSLLNMSPADNHGQPGRDPPTIIDPPLSSASTTLTAAVEFGNAAHNPLTPDTDALVTCTLEAITVTVVCTEAPENVPSTRALPAPKP